jgi:hypothetical protein
MPMMALNPQESLDQLGIQCDRGVEDPGHWAIFLGLAGEADKRRFVKVWHLCAQGEC